MNTFRLDQQMSEQPQQETISAVDKATIIWAIKIALEATNRSRVIRQTCHRKDHANAGRTMQLAAIRWSELSHHQGIAR